MGKRRKKPKINNIEIEKASLGKVLLGSFLNFCFLIAGWVVLFFAVCYPSIHAAPSVIEANSYSANLKGEAGLILPSSCSAEEYKQAIDSFFFEKYPNELEEKYVEPIGEEATLMAFYNINILRLPVNPTPTNYETALFSYQLGEDGLPDVDKMGVQNEDLNNRGLSDVRTLYRDGYAYLDPLLQGIDQRYADNLAFLNSTQMYGNLAAFLTSYLLFTALLPLALKNRAHLGDRLLDVGTCDPKGYETPILRIFLKSALGLIIPIFAIIFMSAYTITLLLVFPYFLNLVYCIVFQKEEPLLETVCGIKLIDNKHSTVFADDIDERMAERNALTNYTEKDYVVKLAAAEAMNIEEEGTAEEK